MKLRNSRKLYSVTAISLVMMLTGACAKESSKEYINVQVCPPLVQYTPEEHLDVVAKKQAVPHEAWTRWIDDYYNLREDIRDACNQT